MRTTKSIQIDTGDITPINSTPIDSKMLDSMVSLLCLRNFVEQMAGVSGWIGVFKAFGRLGDGGLELQR